MLNTKKLESLKPQPKQYKATDYDGLYLVVTPSNAKSWRYNYRVSGKQLTKTYGLYPEIGLAKARLLHSEFKDWLAGGMASDMPLFESLANDWLKLKEKSLSNAKNKLNTYSKVERFLLPKLGKMPIDTIRRVHLVEVVKAVEAQGIVETAHRMSSIIRQILDYAIDLGLIESHAANGLTRVLRPPVVNHIVSIPPDEAGQLFRDIAGYHEPVTRLGLMLLAHTFVRTTELRLMEWGEIRDEVFWVIPAERMKMKVPHVVPLSRQTLVILDELRICTGHYELTLNSPDRPNHPLSENTLLFALYRLGYRGRMTGHGFRSLASTVLNEQSPFSRDVIERQLAHKETDDVRKAYNRAEYLDERVKLMQWWSDWIEGSSKT